VGAEHCRPGAVSRVWQLLRDHEKWWLTPVVIALLVLSLFALLSTSAAAPFIYTLF
jgi:drug/metabolite transporter superfamily protein YnfA